MILSIIASAIVGSGNGSFVLLDEYSISSTQAFKPRVAFFNNRFILELFLAIYFFSTNEKSMIEFILTSK
jgi:hypothetical protein